MSLVGFIVCSRKTVTKLSETNHPSGLYYPRIIRDRAQPASVEETEDSHADLDVMQVAVTDPPYGKGISCTKTKSIFNIPSKFHSQNLIRIPKIKQMDKKQIP